MRKQEKTIDIAGELFDVTVSRNRSHDLKYRIDKRNDFGHKNKWGDLMVRIEPVEPLEIDGMVLKGMLYTNKTKVFETPSNVYHQIFNYLHYKDFNLNNL